MKYRNQGREWRVKRGSHYHDIFDSSCPPASTSPCPAFRGLVLRYCKSDTGMGWKELKWAKNDWQNFTVFRYAPPPPNSTWPKGTSQHQNFHYKVAWWSSLRTFLWTTRFLGVAFLLDKCVVNSTAFSLCVPLGSILLANLGCLLDSECHELFITNA